MDIATYLRAGTGRHGDSLGNRETFSTPGMQWMSVGSGVMHAEGGGTDASKGDDPLRGFQIWINVPSQHKMDDPDYGTHPNDELPIVNVGSNSRARVLAGEAPNTNQPTNGTRGPFRTKQPVQMIDFEIRENDEVEFEVTDGLDTVMLYVYEGSLSSVNGDDNQQRSSIEEGSVLLFDADHPDRRRVCLTTPPGQSAGVMLFAGKKLKEPIAWHGPFVMNTQEEIHETFSEMRAGTFPPKRVDWNYKKYSSRPADWEPMPSRPSTSTTTTLGNSSSSCVANNSKVTVA